MNRTDLAIELKEQAETSTGIECETENVGILTVTKIRVINESGSRNIGRPIGTYINIDVPDLTLHGGEYELLQDIIIDGLNCFDFPSEDILVAGLGNRNITPDTLGPATADSILATRHISKELKEQTGLESLKNVSVILPGVLGQTGIETLEIIKGVIASANIKGLIVIDAFAANDVKRLATTIQLCDTGISPGSGVGNNRKEISKNTLGIPVIAIGVPTCVDASVIAASFNPESQRSEKVNMIVTPREIDMLIDRSATILSRAINFFLQPDTDRQLLISVV